MKLLRKGLLIVAIALLCVSTSGPRPADAQNLCKQIAFYFWADPSTDGYCGTLLTWNDCMNNPLTLDYQSVCFGP